MEKIAEIRDILTDKTVEDDLYGEINLSTEFSAALLEFEQNPQQLDEFIPEFFGYLFPRILSDFRNAKLTRIDAFLEACALFRQRSVAFCLQFVPNDVSLLGLVLDYFCVIQSLDLEATNRSTGDASSLRQLNFDISQNLDESVLQQEVKFIVFAFLAVLAFTPLELASLGDFEALISRNCVEHACLGNKLSQIAMDVLARFSVRLDFIHVIGPTHSQYFGEVIAKHATEEQALVISAFQYFSGCIEYCQEDLWESIQFPDSTNLSNAYNGGSQLIEKAILIYASRRARMWLGRSFRNEEVPLLDELRGFSVPEEFDVFIDIMLQALSAEAEECRELAAVQLAAVAQKLPRMFCNELFDAAAELLGPGERPEGQSGAIIFIAELLRRRLLSVDELRPVVEMTICALSATGRGCSFIKDACCYCFWSLARGYNSEELFHLGNVLQDNLAAVCCLDSDASIRRAACAAYHELCGRHPEVFKVVAETCSLLDYYSVGNYGQACKIAIQFVKLLPPAARVFSKYVLDIYCITEDQTNRSNIAEVYEACGNEDAGELFQMCIEADNWPEYLGALELMCFVNNIGEEMILQVIGAAHEIILDNNTALEQFIDIAADLLRENLAVVGIEAALSFIERHIDFATQALFTNLSVASSTKEFSNGLIRLGERLGLKNPSFSDLSISGVIKLQFYDLSGIDDAANLIIGFLKQYNSKFAESEHFKARIMMLETLLYIRGLFTHEHAEDLIDIMLPCLNDYSADTRGDVGAQVRMRAFIVLAEFAGALDLYFWYEHYFIAQCCSRIQILRIEAVKRLFSDVEQGFVDIGLPISELDKYTGLLALQQQLDSRQYYDLAALDDDQRQLFLQQTDYIMMQNSFKLVADVFLTDEKFASHCLKSLIICFGMATLDDEEKILSILARIEPSELLLALTSSLALSADSAYVRNLKLSSVVLLAELLLTERVPCDELTASDIASVFNIVKLKSAQLRHICALSQILGCTLSSSGTPTVRAKSLDGLKRMLTAKTVRWREIAISQLYFLPEDRLSELCRFDFDGATVSQCRNFVEAFDFGLE